MSGGRVAEHMRPAVRETDVRPRWPASRSPSSGARSSSWAWSRAWPSTDGRPWSPSPSRSPARRPGPSSPVRVVVAAGAVDRRRPGRRRPPRDGRRRAAGGRRHPEGPAARPNPLAGRRRPRRVTARRAAGQPVHRHPHPGARDRVGQGWRRQVVGHHQPLDRARRSAAAASPRSTPTCGASRCRACSASRTHPGSSTT